MTTWTASPRAISVAGTNGAELVACAPLGMAGTKEWAERAALMAAAPDLLAACKHLLDEVRWESMRADYITDAAMAHIALAEAAITKAGQP